MVWLWPTFMGALGGWSLFILQTLNTITFFNTAGNSASTKLYLMLQLSMDEQCLYDFTALGFAV